MISHSIKFRLLLGGMLWCLIVISVAITILYSLYVYYQKETYYAGLIKNLKLLRDFHNHHLAQTPDELELAKQQISSFFEYGRYDEPYSAWFWQITDTNGNVIKSNSLFDCHLIEATVHCPNSSRDINANEMGQQSIASGVVTEEFKYHIYKTKGIMNQDVRVIVSNFVQHQFRPAKFQYTISGRYMGLDELSKDFYIGVAFSSLILFFSTLVAIILSIRFGFKPLDLIRRRLDDIRQGKAEQVIGNFPNEIKPLVDDFHVVFQDFNRLEVENLSHNLKTPISVLINESAKNRGELSEVVKRQAHIINKSIEHYLQRVQQPLDLETIYTGVNLQVLFKELRNQIKLLPNHRKVHVHLSCEKLVLVKANQQDLFEVLLEIIVNAIKYARQQIQVTAGSYGDNAVINIEDDGPGIGELEQDSVFNRRISLDTKTNSTGIGLSAARNKILAMQGSLLLKTSSLGGLRAVISLPTFNS